MPDLNYSDSHVWAKRMDRLVRCGLDDLASTLAAEADAVSLPSIDSNLKENEVLARITAGDKQVEIPSPLDGKICAVNRDLEEDPTLVWKAPYGRGWLVMIEPDPSQEDLSTLRSGLLAEEWFARQSRELSTVLMEQAGKKQRDRGVSSNPLLSHDGHLIREVVRERWDRIKRILFRR